jgi:hypothetical protein
MKTKIEYEPEGQVILGGMEWNWDTLRELCFSDFVYEARPRGTICNRFKIPREILNSWIETEDWETAKKSHWQRPYSYRIDGDLSNLMQNIHKLCEIQKEINDIDFQSDNLLSRVTINIDIKDKDKFKKLKTIVIEKYKVIFQDEPDEFGNKNFDDIEEIRYKTEVKDESVTLMFSKIATKIK